MGLLEGFIQHVGNVTTTALVVCVYIYIWECIWELSHYEMSWLIFFLSFLPLSQCTFY